MSGGIVRIYRQRFVFPEKATRKPSEFRAAVSNATGFSTGFGIIVFFPVFIDKESIFGKNLTGFNIFAKIRLFIADVGYTGNDLFSRNTALRAAATGAREIFNRLQ